MMSSHRYSVLCAGGKDWERRKGRESKDRKKTYLRVGLQMGLPLVKSPCSLLQGWSGFGEELSAAPDLTISPFIWYVGTQFSQHRIWLCVLYRPL